MVVVVDMWLLAQFCMQIQENTEYAYSALNIAL